MDYSEQGPDITSADIFRSSMEQLQQENQALRQENETLRMPAPKSQKKQEGASPASGFAPPSSAVSKADASVADLEEASRMLIANILSMCSAAVAADATGQQQG